VDRPARAHKSYLHTELLTPSSRTRSEIFNTSLEGKIPESWSALELGML
jgi:hypothetical protein